MTSKYELQPIVFVGIKDICDALGCGKNTFYKWVRHEKLPAFKDSGTWRLVPEDGKRWMQSRCSSHNSTS